MQNEPGKNPIFWLRRFDMYLRIRQIAVLLGTRYPNNLLKKNELASSRKSITRLPSWDPNNSLKTK
jgi:hypothetical protein